MSAYIVAYAKCNYSGAEIDSIKDHYEVFIDGNTEKNRKAAMKRYKKLRKKPLTYSVSVAKIVASTDYDC